MSDRRGSEALSELRGSGDGGGGPGRDGERLGAVLGELGLSAEGVRGPGGARAAGAEGALLLAVPGGRAPGERHACVAGLGEELGESERLLLLVEGAPSDGELAAWRNALWPLVHVTRVVRARGGRAVCGTLQGERPVEGTVGFEGAVLVGDRLERVLEPKATAQKFDANAQGWNGERASPGYGHFRWMRRLVGCFVDPPPHARILDFGCGAGWVGIEAAGRCAGSSLDVFDPSPEMVRLAERNARESGVPRFRGRVGFGEDPPFPLGGERGYDLVLSSGVVSFSADRERFLDGIARCVVPGGTLVIGDIHRESHGFRVRRRRKPLLPVRELNAATRDEVRAGLEARGFVHERSVGYQLTRPVPEAMHVSETRLAGALHGPLLFANRLATRLDRALGSPLQQAFDSWVMRFTRVDE